MEKVSEIEIEAALASLARLIERYGDQYWPLFERLETELYSRNMKAARLNRYGAGASLLKHEKTDSRSLKVHRL